MRKFTRGVAASLAGAAVLAWVGAAAAAGPPLGDYTVYGENGVVVGFESTVKGLVGARNNDPAAGNNAIKVNSGAKIDGDARSGGNVNLQNNASITGTVYRPAGTTLTLNAGSSVGTDAFPVDPMLPTLPPPTVYACPTGGADHTGGNGQSLTLMPGTHGALDFGSGFDLTLDGTGDYFFDSIHAGVGATLTVTSPDTHVFVCGAVVFGSVQVTTPQNSPCTFSVEVHASGADAFQAAANSNWIGNVFAPFGEIHVGSGGTTGSFVGSFWSSMVDIEHAVSGSSGNCGGGGGNEEFRSNKDATILHFRKNTNNGANQTYYHDNTGGSQTQYDGYTVDLSAQAVVQPCQSYHLKLGVADASDRKFDSGVFIEKIPAQYNVGHLVTAQGDTVHPDGKYLVAMNKWSLDRFADVGPLLPQNFQLVDINAPKMQLLYDMPIGIGEPHYAQMIRADKLHPIQAYTPAGTDAITGKLDPEHVVGGKEGIERKSDGVHVHMTAIRSHFTPDIIRVKKGDMVHIHLTNLEQAQDATHGFGISAYNINLSLEPGKHENVDFKADRAGVFPFYCTEFCSALHLEMAGYFLVEPKEGGKTAKAIWAKIEDEQLSFLDFVERNDLQRIATNCMLDDWTHSNPRKITSPDEVMQILKAAY